MGLFDGIGEVEETEVVEESVVEKKAAFIKDSGAYKITITKFWFDQNDNGTTFYNWEGETEDGQKISDREWFVTKDGRMQFDETDFKTKEKTGKKKDFSGYARLKVIARALTGNADSWRTEIEKKFVPIYNFEKREDVDKEVDVFMPAIGKEVEILVRRTLEDKTELDTGTGKYLPIAEVKAYNDVRAWLDPETHKSYSEMAAGKEAAGYKAFLEKIEEEPIFDKRDVSKNVDVNAPKEEKSEGSAEAQNAFA